ncbi:MAG: Hsp20 family protein [Gammaproteobacteria bacterium]|nr:Hsp20 family protein [Gammaproteobacteria bacterium]
MNTIRYNPWSLVDRLHRDVDRLFPARLLAEHEDETSELGNWRPAVDIKEEENRFLIRADVPGVDASNLEITMDDGALTIHGHRETTAEEERQGWHRTERLSGRFYRRFSLPEAADAESIEADYKDGVLEISIPKQARSLPRRIQVNAN